MLRYDNLFAYRSIFQAKQQGTPNAFDLYPPFSLSRPGRQALRKIQGFNHALKMRD